MQPLSSGKTSDSVARKHQAKFSVALLYIEQGFSRYPSYVLVADRCKQQASRFHTLCLRALEPMLKCVLCSFSDFKYEFNLSKNWDCIAILKFA